VSLPRFLADEDLRHDIIEGVRRLEPAIRFATVVSEGLGSASDEMVLEYAATGRWLLVSHDVDTMKAVAEVRLASGERMAGLFLVPQSRTTRVVAASLLLIWSASQAEEWEGRIVYLPL